MPPTGALMATAAGFVVVTAGAVVVWPGSVVAAVVVSPGRVVTAAVVVSLGTVVTAAVVASVVVARGPVGHDERRALHRACRRVCCGHTP